MINKNVTLKIREQKVKPRQSLLELIQPISRSAHENPDITKTGSPHEGVHLSPSKRGHQI
jgi:hypothetical protein